MLVADVAQPQRLSPLLADQRYYVYVQETNAHGSINSTVVEVITKQASKFVCKYCTSIGHL